MFRPQTPSLGRHPAVPRRRPFFSATSVPPPRHLCRFRLFLLSAVSPSSLSPSRRRSFAKRNSRLLNHLRTLQKRELRPTLFKSDVCALFAQTPRVGGTPRPSFKRHFNSNLRPRTEAFDLHLSTFDLQPLHRPAPRSTDLAYQFTFSPPGIHLDPRYTLPQLFCPEKGATP